MTKISPLLAAFALTIAGLGATATVADADPGPACLWAGDAHPQGATVNAGGRAFTCGFEGNAAHWFQGGAASGSTVPNPGADSNPADKFTAGARQPGTAYDDYCVGDQLIPGTDDIYEATPNGRGGLFWKTAGPVSQWSFGTDQRPPQTTRTASLCIDGVLS